MKPYPKEFEPLFQKYFNCSLRKFFHPMFGFDIVRLDDYMKQRFGYIEDGKTSLSDFIAAKFDANAVSLVKSLL